MDDRNPVEEVVSGERTGDASLVHESGNHQGGAGDEPSVGPCTYPPKDVVLESEIVNVVKEIGVD